MLFFSVGFSSGIDTWDVTDFGAINAEKKKNNSLQYPAKARNTLRRAGLKDVHHAIETAWRSCDHDTAVQRMFPHGGLVFASGHVFASPGSLLHPTRSCISCAAGNRCDTPACPSSARNGCGISRLPRAVHPKGRSILGRRSGRWENALGQQGCLMPPSVSADVLLSCSGRTSTKC